MVMDFLVGIGHGFEDADEPRSASWPGPSLPEDGPFEMYGETPFQAVDPFYVESLRAITSQNPGEYQPQKFTCTWQ